MGETEKRKIIELHKVLIHTWDMWRLPAFLSWATYGYGNNNDSEISAIPQKNPIPASSLLKFRNIVDSQIDHKTFQNQPVLMKTPENLCTKYCETRSNPSAIEFIFLEVKICLGVQTGQQRSGDNVFSLVQAGIGVSS